MLILIDTIEVARTSLLNKYKYLKIIL